MKTLKRIICKLFGHSWYYEVVWDNHPAWRECVRCGHVDGHKIEWEDGRWEEYIPGMWV